MTGKSLDQYREKQLKFLVALRDVGTEAKFHMYDILLDPHNIRTRKNQFIAVAIVSKTEIIREDFSVLKKFTDYLHTIDDPSEIVPKVIHQGRVAVAMNAGEKYFFEHGECRIFDPHREILFQIIDKESVSPAGRKKRDKIKTYDKGGRGVLENMKNAYIKTFPGSVDAILLLFSFYIPCSIDFHECARLIQMFVKVSGYELAIGYEHLYSFTDPDVSMKWLNMRNITVFCNTELEREIQSQMCPLMRRQDDDCDLECKAMCRDDEDIYDDYADDIDDIRVTKKFRRFGKGFCRKILKECNNL